MLLFFENTGLMNARTLEFSNRVTWAQNFRPSKHYCQARKAFCRRTRPEITGYILSFSAKPGSFPNGNTA